MATFPIHSGVFNLPAGTPAKISSVTISNGGTGTSTVTITGPSGNVVYQASLGIGGTATLSGNKLLDLSPGSYTVAVTGSVTGIFTTE